MTTDDFVILFSSANQIIPESGFVEENFYWIVFIDPFQIEYELCKDFRNR